MTVSVGPEAVQCERDWNKRIIYSNAANATPGQITLQKLSAGAGITVSMGTGSGGITMVSSVTNGNFTLTRLTGGFMDINT